MSKAQQSPSTEDEASVQAWLDLLGELSDEELAEIEKNAEAIDAEVVARGPQTPDELWDYFKQRYKVELPRVAVCPGHSSQFEVICDIYFYTILRLLWIVSRGGGKTSSMAWVHDASAENFPGYKGLTVGASLSQGERMYEHLLPFVVEGGVIGGNELPHIARSIEKKTTWKTGSQVEIVAATIANVNGPRMPRLHRDEVEIMYREKEDVYKQAENIPAGAMSKDGRYMKAQVIDTSTMKWAHGLVAAQKEEYETAITEGRRPPTVVKITCLFEIAREVPHCRAVPEEDRKARIRELIAEHGEQYVEDYYSVENADPCATCDCDIIVKGTWDDDKRTERTLESVCAGRFARSRGFKPRDDVITLFYGNGRREWEAEQECSRPSGEGLYIESFSRVRHGLKHWNPDPNIGKIFQAVDWGGTDAHSVGWYQEVDHPVTAELWAGGLVTIPAGACVRFAEIYRGGIGNVAVGRMAIAMEDAWRKQYGASWYVSERYPDPANNGARLDWRDHLGLETTNRIKKDFLEEVKLTRDMVDDRLAFVVVDACTMWVKSIEAWHEEKGHEVHDWSTHPMAEFRYYAHNRNVVRRKGAAQNRQSTPAAAASSRDDEYDERERSPIRERDTIEIVGVGGADDSPYRRGGRRIGRGDERGFLNVFGTGL
jgi:hypothetical protein